MSAPVLSYLEQKSAISGKKKKKKTIKNVLSIPSSFKIESQIVKGTFVKKLSKILERLLQTARLPLVKNEKCNEDSSESAANKSKLNTDAKSRRNQLSLGVNALNRSIKKESLSAVLLADNIQPKFLIEHLILLCNYKKIPFLLMPGLREITRSSLGFPCIAVGFKKDFCEFSEAVEEIKSILQTNKITSDETILETESDNEEIMDVEIHEEKVENDKIPFSYLYRSSTKKRVFLIENKCDDQSKAEQETGFINLSKYDEIKSKNNTTEIHPKLPLRYKRPVKKLKELKDFKNSEVDDNNDLELPKKKVKKDWIIDKRGTKQSIKYYPANLVRVALNPDRIRKNK